jgi:hypothetical protein
MKAIKRKERGGNESNMDRIFDRIGMDPMKERDIEWIW